MATNTILFGWNRPIPGREEISQAHFGDLMAWLGEQKAKGNIESFAPVFLDTHGGDLNGFFLIHGNPQKLDALCGSEDWVRHMARAAMHLEGAGQTRGVSGELLMKRFELWSSLIP